MSRAPRTPGAGLGALLRSTYDWKALRESPDGLTPVLVVAAFGFVAGLSTRVLELSTLDIARDLGFTLEGIVKFTSAAGTVALLAALAVGHLGDRRTRVRMLGAGLALAGAAGAAAGAAGSPLTLGAAVVASDVFFFMAAIPTVSLLADWYPHLARGRAFALVGLGQALGTALAYSLGGELIDGVGWRLAYPLLFAPVIALGAYAALVLREPPRGRFEGSAHLQGEASEATPPSFAEAWRAIWGIRVVRRLFVADVFSTAGAVVFGAALILNLVERHAYTPSDLGSVFAGGALFAVAGALLGGSLVDRFAKRRPSELLTVFGAFTAASALAAAGPLASQHRAVLVASVGSYLFGAALLGPTLGVLYASVIPPHIRTLGGSVRALSRLPAVLVALPFLNVIIEAGGLHASMWMAPPLLLLAAAMFAGAAPLYELDRRSAASRDAAILHWHGAPTEGGGALLVCRGVGVEHVAGVLLSGVDLEVDAGEIVAVVGGNGSGKTSLLRAVAGLTPATSGAVLLGGRDATFKPPHEIARWGVQLVPAGGGVFEGLTVSEHLALAVASMAPRDATAETARVLDRFPALADRLATDAEHLSTGERRMLSLGLALLARPRLLMVDELSAGLAPSVVRELLRTLRDARDAGLAVVLAEPSAGAALDVADRVMILEHGEAIFTGPPELAAGHPALRPRPAPLGSDRLASRLDDDAGDLALEVVDVVKQFGGVVALERVSAGFRAGVVTAMVGPNGSGKTTLLDIMGGQEAPESGRVWLRGEDVTDLPTHDRARRGLLRRFEEPRLVPSLAVGELLALAHETQPANRFADGMGGRARVERALALLDLGDARHALVGDLDTGTRRLVDLATVVVQEPSVLLLDEPSNGLGRAGARALAVAIRRMQRELGTTMVVVDHDLDFVAEIADDVIVLDRGEVAASGPAADVLEDAGVRATLLGAAVGGPGTGGLT